MLTSAHRYSFSRMNLNKTQGILQHTHVDGSCWSRIWSQWIDDRTGCTQESIVCGRLGIAHSNERTSVVKKDTSIGSVSESAA